MYFYAKAEINSEAEFCIRTGFLQPKTHQKQNDTLNVYSLINLVTYAYLKNGTKIFCTWLYQLHLQCY